MASGKGKATRSVSTPSATVPKITFNDGRSTPGSLRTPVSQSDLRYPSSGSSLSSLESSPEETAAQTRGKVRLRSHSVAHSPSKPDVSPKISKFGQQIRQGVPHTLTCSMFCGGRNCKYESAASWPAEAQALTGVFSHWVTKDILAMARPNTNMIKRYDLISQFKRNEIKSIVNLQERGEHAHCGNGVETSGFSYDPEVFMSKSVYFFNFGWKDFGTPHQRTILDMVKVMDFAVQQGKVAVHCHAGLGRTGMLIACYLIYGECMTAAEAITLVRRRRPGSIQTEGQIETVQAFGDYMKPLRTVFTSCSAQPEVRLTAAEHLSNEQLLLHGWSAREKRFVPKIVAQLCKQLQQSVFLPCPNSPLSTSSLTPLTPSRESKHSSASPLASTPKRSPSSCSLPELGSVSSSPLHRTNLASSEKKRKTGVGTSSRGSSLSPVPLDHLSASPILPAAPSTKQPGLNRSFLSLPVSSSSRAPSGSLSHSATNLPALGVASSSSHLSALTERPRAMSSDQLHLIPDYEKGELLTLNVEHPTNLPRMGSPPPMKTVDSMSSLSSISLDRSPPAHEQRLCSHRKSSRKYSAREVLHVMAKSPNLDHSLSGRVFQIMRAVNENKQWSMLESESHPQVLWTLLLQWLASLKEPLVPLQCLEKSSPGDQKSEVGSFDILKVCGEVNLAIIKSLVKSVSEISSLVEGPGKDQLEDMVLTQLASVLSHVLSSQAKDSQEVAEKPRILATVEVVDDTGCQRTKQLLRQLLSELSLSR